MAYASVEELQFLLGKPTLTVTETTQLERDLEAAATEIDWELGYTELTPAPDPPPPLVVEVNLERAMEHWKQKRSPGFGVLAGSANDAPATFAPRDSWHRHHLKLLPLKEHQGVA